MTWRTADIASMLVTHESGSRPKGGATVDSGEVPSLGGENILTDGGVTLESVNRVPVAFYSRMSKGHLSDLDVLINKDGAQTGKIGLYIAPDEGPACINEHLFLLRGDPEQVTQRYLYYTLLSEAAQRQIRAEITGSAQPGLKSGFVDKVSLPIPDDTREQDKIAEVLSTIDLAIDETEALVAKQERIKTGLMQDLLTFGIDEHGTLRSEKSHDFTDSSAGRIPTEWLPAQVGSKLQLQRGHDITESILVPGPFPVISSGGIVGYHDTATSSGPNVVVGRKGTIGKVHFVESNFWAHDTSLYVTRFTDVEPRFVYYLFTNSELARFGTKSGSPSLNRNDIHPLWFGWPERDEQMRIVQALDAAENAVLSTQQHLEKLTRLKYGLMADLLSGDRRVTALLAEREAVTA